MADVLGIPAKTVAQYDRLLAEAGLRTVSGRGTSAAKVTATDAANLLIAVLGSPISGPSIKAAKLTCETFSSLRTDDYSEPGKFRRFGLLSLAALPKKHTFREALAALIQGASHGELFLISDRDDKLTEDDYLFGVEVRIPGPWGAISVDSVGDGDPSDISSLHYYADRELAPEQYEGATSDLGLQREISYRTLRVLGNLIAS
ncbi:MAG: hypothetical protein WDN46_23250 [Methylocella sp.]